MILPEIAGHLPQQEVRTLESTNLWKPAASSIFNKVTVNSLLPAEIREAGLMALAVALDHRKLIDHIERREVLVGRELSVRHALPDTLKTKGRAFLGPAFY